MFMKRNRKSILVLVAGGILPLAFAPYHIYIIAIISPIFLFAICRNALVKQTLWYGWLFGLGYFGVGVSWIYIAIHDFGHTSVVLALSITGLFIAFLSLFPALLAGLITFLFPNENKTKYLLVWPTLWVIIEWIRGWIFTGFPWLSLGYSQFESPLSNLAPILGVYGVSLAVVLSASLIILACYWGNSTRFIAIGGLGSLWIFSFFLSFIPWTTPIGNQIQVTLIQGNTPQDIKWEPNQVRLALEKYHDLTEKHWDSDLIIWPEGALPVLYHQIAQGYLSDLEDEAKTHHTDLLIGLPFYNQEGGKYYNGLLNLGAKRSFYYKYHLVPFGEYIPLSSYLQGVIDFFNLPISSFSHGEKQQPLLQVAGYLVAASICYEDAFGEEITKKLPEAKFLVNVTNNAWYGDSLAPHQHLQIAQMRSLEVGRDLARATTNGISAIINAKGRLIATTDQFITTTLTGIIQPREGKTPYVFWGNSFIIGLCFVSFIFSVIKNRQPIN
ncbi:Apolipoprotein N-acyltransferase [Candidatus Nitrosacidococcus tergens]|uniref:Apolipoprotein N-acyltransferase n=2 Tax=Candidatus Nitrosacidococcus tergens TaxID=553981 RepID=A0A7G1Q740_9GAMM|nr:Apolipoprotein N-acyltransferase [Candidatus Nitrosacidococcus tergens]